VLNSRDDSVVQALAHVARLGGYTLASVATSDDAQKKVLTVKLIGVSGGFVQESLPYTDESELLVAHVNGRGEVEAIDGLQPGDLAETEAEANAEIAAAAEQLPDAPGDDEPLRDPEQPLVGELAAAARHSRRRK